MCNNIKKTRQHGLEHASSALKHIGIWCTEYAKHFYLNTTYKGHSGVHNWGGGHGPLISASFQECAITSKFQFDGMIGIMTIVM